MYIFKNALMSITRNKGRNILITIIFMIVAISCSVTLATLNSASSLISSYESKYDVEATIGINRETMMKKETSTSDTSTATSDKRSIEDMREIYSSIAALTKDDIDSYGNSSYVKSYYYTNSIGLDGSNIEKAEVSNTKTDTNTTQTTENSNAPKMDPNMNSREDQPQNMGTRTDFTLTGYSTYEAMSDFINGKYTIIKGSVSEDFDAMNCVINEELASVNDIEVGDKITLVDPNDETKTYDLTVTGIFTESESENSDMMSMFSNSVNTIITNTNTVEKIQATDDDISINVTPTFILTSSDVVDAFTTEVKNKGLNEYLTVSTNLDDIANSTEAISNVSTFATTFLIITLGIGSVVLCIINMINLRERKYEIGVYRTIGMKKSTLTLQFLSELLIVGIIGLITGAIIGACISVPISNKLLASEISNSNAQTENIGKNFGGNMGRFDSDNKINGIVKVQEFESVNAVVNIKVLAELLGIGVLLTLISSLSFMISIERFSPLTILKERS